MQLSFDNELIVGVVGLLLNPSNVLNRKLDVAPPPEIANTFLGFVG